jgi:hypothetical protein
MGQFKDPNVISLHGVIVKSKFCVSCIINHLLSTEHNRCVSPITKKSRQPLQTQHQHKQHLVDYTKTRRSLGVNLGSVDRASSGKYAKIA